jgi:hypothetical protein
VSKSILHKFRPLQQSGSSALAVLLLASLVWVTTAEFNHQHGLRPKPASAPAKLQQNDSAISLETDNTNGGLSRARTSGDCAICQVHQNLSTTLFSSPLTVSPIQTEQRISAALVTAARGKCVANQQGRAPPVFSLS